MHLDLGCNPEGFMACVGGPDFDFKRNRGKADIWPVFFCWKKNLENKKRLGNAFFLSSLKLIWILVGMLNCISH